MFPDSTFLDSKAFSNIKMGLFRVKFCYQIVANRPTENKSSMKRRRSLLALVAESRWLQILEQSAEAVHFPLNAFPQDEPGLRNNNEKAHPQSLRATNTGHPHPRGV